MNTQRFYDDLADDYHLNHADWSASVHRQGGVLDAVIRRHRVREDRLRLLDCSCGIGTQAIGLALRDYEVTGTDLSPRSIERAREEAARFGVKIEFSVADMRTLNTQLSGEFDVVISCDNSVSHLHGDGELLQSLAEMYERLSPEGILVVGIRDYDGLIRERPRFTPPQIVNNDGLRSVLFQLWDWVDDGKRYVLTMFISKQTTSGWTTSTHTTTYRALLRDELAQLARDAGFVDPEWHFPAETGHHQPLMTAVRPAAERTP